MTRIEIQNKAEEYGNNQKTFTDMEKTIAGMAFQDGGMYVLRLMNDKGIALQSDMDETIKQNMELKAQIEKLKDKVEMLDFFYEGNGFKRRGLNNSIQIAEYIKKLEEENVKQKEYNAKLLQSDIDKSNKISHLSSKVNVLQKQLTEKDKKLAEVRK